MANMHRRTFLVMALAGLSGCVSTRPAPKADPAMPTGLDGPYRLDSGDKLRVTVFEQASLSNTYSVDQAGYISFPLIGNVPARGLTTQELAGSIAKGLRAGYLRNPDVSVEVDTYRPFFIMGEVRNPGQYTYVNGLTAQTAIAIAGGFTARASEGSVQITRQINGQVYTGAIPLTAPVRPGDVIRVGQRLF
ncbi:polysaccharide biosynthesis/export family protein [Oryzibacter oryziterrae]|uniref:polysaccharide biosynthesis/export family protein n=1 Tax=Oryzibacter oryziterrae TaxID=2766474 RepID=UPI001F2CC98B|nr:polysaccharide biosynthesis/export family protein [Oryzibacter oryziterrae]